MSDLVVASLEAWDEVWRRNLHLVAGLLRKDPELRVLFVEPAADPAHQLTRRVRPQWGKGLRPLPLPGAEGRIWVFQPTKLLPRRWDRRADARLAAQTVRAANRLGFDHPILWINDPAAASLLLATGWPALYDITDDWLLADRTPAEHARLVSDEAELMRRCAEVVVCSQNLKATKGRQRPVTLIHNAVNVEFYRRPAARPADLPAGPIALYLGTAHRDRVDIELCCRSARAIAGIGRVVLVGPAPLPADDLAALARAGVLVLGPRDRTTVPGYLQHADVLLVPHVVTAFTETLDPIKLYEYQAVGRLVVATPVAGFREASDDRIRLASPEDFPVVLVEALAAAWPFPQHSDRPVASWDDRVTQMAEVIERVRHAATPQ